MEVVIWGVTLLGKYLTANITDGFVNVKPIAFVDNNYKLQNTFVDGIPVISYKQLIELTKQKEIIVLLAVKNARNILRILEQLNSIILDNVGIVKPNVLLSGACVNLFEQDEKVIWSSFQGKKYRVIPRIEVNLIDACNLKCKGCSHFSSIYNSDSIYPIDNYEKDLKQLRKVGQMFRLRLLGGEPFLLDNLDEYIVIARKVFPEADIEVVTNGLLIPMTNEKVLSAIKTNNISVVISAYKPTLKKKDQIAYKLDEQQILWCFEGEEIVQFSRNLTLENIHNAEISNEKCPAIGCIFLRRGKLYKCPFDGLINDLYSYYNLNRKHESGISIYRDSDSLYKEIVNYIFNPVEMCQYCAETPELIPWSVKAHPVLNDWLYKGDD